MTCLAALAAASGVRFALASVALEAEPLPPRASAPAPVEQAFSTPTPSRHATALTWNPFCPTCAPEATAAPPAPPLELPHVLVATMESTDPLASLATIVHPESGPAVYRVGDPLGPDIRLEEIRRGRIRVTAGSRETWLEVRSPEPEPKKRPSKRKRTRKRGKRELPGARKAISCKKLQCTVDAAFVDRLARSPTLLSKQARVRAYDRNGLTGMRLGAVGPGTVPRLLGLRSGDVVTAVNGKELDTLDAALAVATRLRRTEHLTVEFTRSRKGKRRHLELQIDID